MCTKLEGWQIWNLDPNSKSWHVGLVLIHNYSSIPYQECHMKIKKLQHDNPSNKTWTFDVSQLGKFNWDFLNNYLFPKRSVKTWLDWNKRICLWYVGPNFES